MSGDNHKKSTGLKGKLRAFSSTSHLRELVRTHATTGHTLETTRSTSPPPPLPPLDRVSSHSSKQGGDNQFVIRRPLNKSSSKGTLSGERNDYSYLLRERHSTDMDTTTDATAAFTGQPQAGQPYSFNDQSGSASASASAATAAATAAAAAAAADTRTHNAYSSQQQQQQRSMSMRQSHGSTSTDPALAGVPLRQSPSHQIAASLLKRTGSTAPAPAHRDSQEQVPSGLEHRPTSSSVSSTASKWFRRGKSRQNSKDKLPPPASNYHLDMNFNDLGNFVDLAKVRRPSITSSMGTAESASLSAGHGTGDSGREDNAGGSTQFASSDAVSLYAAERRRQQQQGLVSGGQPHRRSIGSGTSPMLKEAMVAGNRSVASSLQGGIARMSSMGSMVNTDTSTSQKSESVPCFGEYSWQHRDSSVKSRRPTAALDEDEAESEYEYAGSINDHGSVRSVAHFEDRQQPYMQFTDPWMADRNQRQTIHTGNSDIMLSSPVDRRNQSLNNLRGPGRPQAEHAEHASGSGGSAPGVEYTPRKSEPWAPPESWAVLPTAQEGVDEAGAAAGLSNDPVPDGDGASSDSDVSDDGSMYSLRIYKEDSTFGTFHCRLSTTTAEFMSMAAKKFFIPDIARYCLYMQKANGLDRTLGPAERPANILKKYLEQMGYRPEDNITLQGREDNSYLCKFSLSKAAIPRVSPHIEVEVSSFQYIDLRARKLQTVPVFLYAHASKIVSLNMSKNPGLNFPADFVQLCSSLRELRLATCQFSRFPNSIQFSPGLAFLDLSGNDMRRMQRAPLDRLTHLTTLMLRNNRLVELPESLAHLRALRVLNVSNNNLAAFPLVVTRLAALEDLDVSLNRIPSIPDAIAALAKLARLNVMGNALSGTLPDGLGRLAKLEELDVRQNKLQDLGITSELVGLRLLFTESNMVTRAHMDLTCAVAVSLRANKLTQFYLTNLAHTLVNLDLSLNQLTELPSDTFMHLPMLEHLVLDSNHIVSIPSSVGNLSNLVHLSCANNVLSLIPIELTRLEKLTTLDLHNNNLKMLPPEIWLMPKLSSLNLSSNLLEQFPHPSMLENLRRQQGASSSVRAVAAAAAAAVAAAQRNGTKAPIANRVAQSIQMSSISLPSTRQTSPMARAASETGADLVSHNGDSLTVTPPERIRNRSTDAGRVQPLPPVKRYTVSDPPPLSLSLRELRMGDNNMDDEVFTLMAFLPELRVLNLSYNELYDLPPSAMAHMRKLNELYLSGTQLSTIPEEEPNAAFWRSLRLLNINGNKLQTLPSWLAKIHGLSVLDVGSNVLKYNITNWPYDWNWNWNTGLKYLNFSYNERFEIKGAHLHTKVFHDHAKLVGGNSGTSPSGGPARDLFNFIAKEPPKSDCVSDFYQLNDLRILGLLQLTIMVPLPDETPNRRIRTTDPIKRVKYGIADTLGHEDRVSSWDLASSRFRMTDDECLFGLFHARESTTASSAISKYLCDNFLYLFREELEKITDQIQSEEAESRRSGGDQHHVSSAADASGGGKKAVNFAETLPSSSSAPEDNGNRATRLSDEQVQAALRRTFLTLNKDLGTHNRQLVAAAAAAEVYAARTARMSSPPVLDEPTLSSQHHQHQQQQTAVAASQAHRLTSAELNMPRRSSFDPKGPDSAASDNQCGSTAIVAYIHGRTLHVANVGDALGVVSRRGTPFMLSKRHDPYDVSEIVRIRSIGGYITQQGKVQGQTDITRAFGYFHLLPYVNADPTIMSMELTEADEFLIMANRPVWDVITPQIAVDIARKHRRDPRLAAARVRDHVIAYGVTKSIMVMVIGFGPMFTKNTGRPMRGFSVRDSIYPGVPDNRAKYAISRRMSRSPSSAMPPGFASRTSVSHPLSSADGRGFPSMHPIPGAHQTNPITLPQSAAYDFSDEFDEFSAVSSSRTRRQRDRDVNARPGDSTLARLEREVPPPVGEVVLVFTDVKNSTIQWETNQVAMRSAIKVHNSIMRRLLRSIGGYEVKTEGDAFMVSFPTVASALHWCLAVQMTFLTADWPQETLDSPHGCPIYWPPDDNTGADGVKGGRSSGAHAESGGKHLIYRGLRVRMGMHLGSPVSEEDPITRRMDYFGPMVNRASRISGAADGGQVYVSQDVMDEVYAILGIFETADHNGITDMSQIIDEPSLARDVQALKNLGLCAIQVGEIKLKGLESPEFVSMVYPAQLRGRIDMQIQEEEEEQQKQKQILLEQQQQKQQQRKKKLQHQQGMSQREASSASFKLANNNGSGKHLASYANLPHSLSTSQLQRASIDDGSLLEYPESAYSPYTVSTRTSPRGSFSRPTPTQAHQRNMRELSMELAAVTSSTEARSRLRQIGDMPLWSAPVTRRSVSLLQNKVLGPEILECVGEDASGGNRSSLDEDSYHLVPEIEIEDGDMAGRKFSDRSSVARLGLGSVFSLSPRPSVFMPPYYAYLHGSTASSPMWSRQGSVSYFGNQPMPPAYAWQNATAPGSRQLSRSSVDMSLAARAAAATNSRMNSVDMRTIDLLQLELLYRLIYRLQILAVEPDTEMVLPSFEYFVVHRVDDLASYRIHRASTVSVSSLPHHQPIASKYKRQYHTDQQPSISSIEEIPEDQVSGESRDEYFGDASQQPTSSEVTGSSTAIEPSSARPRSASPTLTQHVAAHMPLSHRHTQSALAAVTPSQLEDSSEKATHVAQQLPLALNEPPVPLYLTEDMSHQHLVAILAMLVRQIECAVDALETRLVGKSRAAGVGAKFGLEARNDSKMDEDIVGNRALSLALEQVANAGTGKRGGLDSVGFEWTPEHILCALEAYANKLEQMDSL